MHTTHILCFGNRLHGDDGFGPAVYDYLKQQDYPEHWRIFEAGIMGLDSLSLFENCSRVVIVDAVITDSEISDNSCPELLFFSAESLDSESAWSNTVHDFGLNYLIQALPHTIQSSMPQIAILAIPMRDNQAFQTRLSPYLQAAVKPAGDFLLKRLRKPQAHLSLGAAD